MNAPKEGPTVAEKRAAAQLHREAAARSLRDATRLELEALRAERGAATPTAPTTFSKVLVRRVTAHMVARWVVREEFQGPGEKAAAIELAQALSREADEQERTETSAESRTP